MRRSGIAVLAIVLAVGLAVGFWASISIASAQTKVIGVVKSASGQASILRAGARVPATVGLDVNEADQLRTGADGSMGITLNDGSLVSLGPDTLFELSAFEFEPRRGAFEFLAAILRGTFVYTTGRIGKIAPENVKIETPTSVVAIRGTRFAVRVPAGEGAN